MNICPTCRRPAAHIVDGRCTTCQQAFRVAKRQRKATKVAAMTPEEERAWALREFCAGRAWIRRS